jgi:hypothetical protein
MTTSSKDSHTGEAARSASGASILCGRRQKQIGWVFPDFKLPQFFIVQFQSHCNRIVLLFLLDTGS